MQRKEKDNRPLRRLVVYSLKPACSGWFFIIFPSWLSALNLADIIIHNAYIILRLLEIQFQGQAPLILPELVP